MVLDRPGEISSDSVERRGRRCPQGDCHSPGYMNIAKEQVRCSCVCARESALASALLHSTVVVDNNLYAKVRPCGRGCCMPRPCQRPCHLCSSIPIPFSCNCAHLPVLGVAFFKVLWCLRGSSGAGLVGCGLPSSAYERLLQHIKVLLSSLPGLKPSFFGQYGKQACEKAQKMPAPLSASLPAPV